MDANELRALADALDDCDPPYYESSPQINRSLDACIAKAAAYLRAQADAQPVAWLRPENRVEEECTARTRISIGKICPPIGTWQPLYAHPAPAVPQAEPKRKDQSLRDLLAIIHCDGGHHTEAVGIERSIKDAQDAVCALKVRLALAEPKREPLSDERIDAALQTDPVLITRLMIGSMTVSEFRAALRRLARIVERALEIGGSDAE